MIVLLGRHRILEEEQPVWLERLAECDRLRQRDALVHVVQQLHLLSERGPQMLEELRQHAHVRGRLPDGARVGRADRLAVRRRLPSRAAGAVAGIPRRADLHADMSEAPLHRAAGGRLDLAEAAAAGVEVAVGAVPHLAAQQLIERQPRTLALDVP
jgi:hypothetical protein